MMYRTGQTVRLGDIVECGEGLDYDKGEVVALRMGQIDVSWSLAQETYREDPAELSFVMRGDDAAAVDSLGQGWPLMFETRHDG